MSVRVGRHSQQRDELPEPFRQRQRLLMIIGVVVGCLGIVAGVVGTYLNRADVAAIGALTALGTIGLAAFILARANGHRRRPSEHSGA